MQGLYSLLIIVIVCFSPISMAVENQQATPKFSFLSTDYLEYRQEEQIVYASGNVEIILDDYFLTANTLIYDIQQDKLWAEGDVRIKDKENRIILGETVIFKDKLKEGIISDFILYFGDNTLLISKLAKRVNQDVISLNDSSFTPCKILCNRNPIWQVSSKHTKVDFSSEQMTYKHLFFEVYGVPIFYLPYFMHPTPNAKAKSGILVPGIKNKSLGIPLYYRAMPNLDFTLTPRISSKYNIYELETRYKSSKSEELLLEGSYGKVPYYIEKNGVTAKDTKINSYHLNSAGNFRKDDYKYGFKLEHVSDKAYLKNYYKNYTPYLTSRLYFEQVHSNNYLQMEGLNFQWLGVDNTSNKDPVIFPKIRSKNVIYLNDSETSALIIENNALTYKEQNGKELGRVASQFTIDNNFITSTGHLFNIAVKNRGDVYFINHLYPNTPSNNKVLSRSIPEIQNIWRYPLSGPLGKESRILIEPIASVTFGRKHNSNKKFAFIDSPRYTLSENNLFDSNRYSGIDYHEFGNRISYGMNSAILAGFSYLKLFLGQTYNDNLPDKYRSENVGRISYSFSDMTELFYRFRKDKNFAPMVDEVGGILHFGPLDLMSGFVYANNLNKDQQLDYSTDPQFYSYAKQLYYNLDYRLTDNWLITYNMRIDFQKDKQKVLAKSIQVTYLNDCVRISASLSDDYMVDRTRGIKKSVSLPTITVGLKILNM